MQHNFFSGHKTYFDERDCLSEKSRYLKYFKATGDN